MGNTNLIYWIDLINSTLLPFSIMFFFSISLIVFVHRSRSRSRTNNSSSTSNRDNKFAITVVSLNIMFFLLNFPITLSHLPFIPSDIYLSDISHVFYYAYYSLGFYIQLIVNSDFRQEFLRMIELKELKVDVVTKSNTNYEQ
jgi:hypothetical protein